MSTTQLSRKKFHERLVLVIIEVEDSRRAFRDDVERGLGNSPKAIPPKYFYDDRGSRLFEEITELEEYYPTRTEAAILAEHGTAIVEAAGEGLTLVELGSGSSSKTRLLLDILAGRQERVDYVPIDISPTVVTEFGEKLLADYPSLYIRGLICDYHRALGELKGEHGQRKLFLFLGSSLGNYTPGQSVRLLRIIREAMEPDGRLLLGLDLKKDPDILQRAYDDGKGTTAAFNLNLLTRINRELKGRFEPERFAHRAFYNPEEGRVEMHLESLIAQIVPIEALNLRVPFTKGETIHTENAYKFDRPGLEEILAQCGLTLSRQWLDGQGWFSLNLIEPA